MTDRNKPVPSVRPPPDRTGNKKMTGIRCDGFRHTGKD